MGETTWRDRYGELSETQENDMIQMAFKGHTFCKEDLVSAVKTEQCLRLQMWLRKEPDIGEEKRLKRARLTIITEAIHLVTSGRIDCLERGPISKMMPPITGGLSELETWIINESYFWHGEEVDPGLLKDLVEDLENSLDNPDLADEIKNDIITEATCIVLSGRL